MAGQKKETLMIPILTFLHF